MKVRGTNTMTSALISGAEKSAKVSGFFFATVFGDISPKVRMITVRTAVDIADAQLASEPFFKRSMKRRVVREEARMLTMLFPIKIVERSAS